MTNNVNVAPYTAPDGIPVATEVINDAQVQRSKTMLGDNGIDAGNVSNSNPLPVEISGFFSSIKSVFSKFTFDQTGKLYAIISSGSVSVSSGTVTTVSSVTQANMSIGDTGKLGTSYLMSQMNFQSGVRRNFS